jgi:hypothetical protein
MKQIILITSIMTAFLAFSCKGRLTESIQQFSIGKIARENSDIAKIAEGKGFTGKVMVVKPDSENASITIWKKGDKGDWANSNYFIFEVYGNNNYSGVLTLEFYKNSARKAEKIILQSGEVAEPEKETPWLSCLLGINPSLKTKVVFPLSYLDAQEIFIPRSPRQLKGTISGNRLDPADIIKVNLRFGPFSEPYFLPEFEIASLTLSDTLPTPYSQVSKPVIDSFGQPEGKEWPGRISSAEQLISANLELEKSVANAKFSQEFSKYGGWKAKRFKATGFFRTEHDGQRWWLVDPEGYAFLSVGIDCMRATSSGPVNGIEDLFEWLPEKSDQKFSDAVSERGAVKTVDFYKANLIRVFGKEWNSRWSKMTAGLLRSMNVNTVGNWSDIRFAQENNLPYVIPLNRFPGTSTFLYRDFPDVFSEEYKTNSEEFAKQLLDYKEDPYLIGYFLRNEPQWAFGYHNLAFEMFATDQQSATKDQFVKWISSKYNDEIEVFNKSWQLSLDNFDRLKTLIFKDYPSVEADSDFYTFSTIMVKKYVDVPCDEVVKVDRNHLNLGMRYAWISSDLLYKAGERFDVFSINGYGYNPPPTEEIAKRSNKPVMIGEFHHGAVDRALPATGITGVISQEERAAAYRNYVEQGFARPELIGMHYFQWIDQPYYGRFDGENYNIGVVTIQNLPYPELTEAMRLTNRRIYAVGMGTDEPYKAVVTRIPPIHY